MDDRSAFKKFLPIALEVEQGKNYYWCSCGESQTPPLCDKEYCSNSVPFLATLTEEVQFCNCKQTQNPPWCDGSHAKVLLEAIKNKK